MSKVELLKIESLKIIMKMIESWNIESQNIKSLNVIHKWLSKKFTPTWLAMFWKNSNSLDPNYRNISIILLLGSFLE